MRSYDTGVTLRHFFYRLVADRTLPNTRQAYKRLSELTARARRDRHFPDLIDRVRSIHRLPSFTGPDDARNWLGDVYRRDRTEGQDRVLLTRRHATHLKNLFEAAVSLDGLR